MTSKRGQDCLLKDSASFQGYEKVKCPMRGCTYIEHFVATIQTLAEEEALTRQQESLRLGHLAGRHRRK
jgi:phage FluMu protein Com